MNPALPHYDSLVHMLLAAVDGHPDVTAVVYLDRRISYAEFGRAVAGLARELAKQDVGRGQRAILMMPNSIEMDVALMAVMATGAQVAPVNPFLTLRELEKALVDIDASVVIADQTTAQKAADVARTLGIPRQMQLGPGGTTLDAWTRDASLALDPATLPTLDDLALIIYTGGSTGTPKGVNHTHRGLLAGVYQHLSVWPGTYGGEV
ncbi:MAG TPA: class I adenylate-forming enzyme family protein, partial [Gammaproteobacteria bacterium]|nr:class I adenylate-forming enzyme family protein [Gammaproteobacteria bacterium]